LRFLATSGLWLVLLELTVVRGAWTFDLGYLSQVLFLQVIWVLGISMIVLAALIRLPLPAVAAFGVAMVAGHNALDGVTPQSLGGWGPLWAILHVPGGIRLAPGQVLYVAYPLIPWLGVMAVGYAFGALLLRPAAQRHRILHRLGGALTVGLVLLRASNLYGDPSPWSAQPTAVGTVLSFLDTTKYAPSLLFLLMTLGPSILALPLPVVYLVWAGVVLALYLACRWFAGVKAQRRDPWPSYV
jgi:uncharacterized membrane protein